MTKGMRKFVSIVKSLELVEMNDQVEFRKDPNLPVVTVQVGNSIPTAMMTNDLLHGLLRAHPALNERAIMRGIHYLYQRPGVRI